MHNFEKNDYVEPKDPELLYQILISQYGMARAEANGIKSDKLLIASDIDEHTLRLKGWSMRLPVQMFKKRIMPVTAARTTRTPAKISLESFYRVAAAVKPHTKESVVLHMAAEVGEVSECLVQPDRKGDIVEESVDVILCALDVIYLELGKTHGTEEITALINKKMDAKAEKWLNTCKR